MTGDTRRSASEQRIGGRGERADVATVRAAGWRTHAAVSNWVRAASGLASASTATTTIFQLEATRLMPERIASDTTTAR
jgi:hypothetical protein